MTRGFVVSDLHLLASRSDSQARLQAIRETLDSADFLVLNGDIFDFQWSRFRTHDSSARVARRWIEDLVDGYPNCRFYFTLGNHDCVPVYCEVLERLSTSRSNVAWDEHYIRLGDCLFLHGDVSIRSMTDENFIAHRRRWSRKRRRPRLLHPWYDLAGKTRVDRALQRLWFPRRACSRRIVQYLESAAPHELPQLERIYFGHTHRSFDDYTYRGLRFFNSGSGIRGAEFMILPVELKVDGHAR